jgi:hypothetical protein
MENRDVSGEVLRAMADAYPQPVHFGYLGLALGVTSGAMWRALTALRRNALITVDRSLASNETPFAQTRITGKGLAVTAGIADPSDDAAATLRELEAVTLDRLQHSREHPPITRIVPARPGAAPERHLDAAAA